MNDPFNLSDRFFEEVEHWTRETREGPELNFPSGAYQDGSFESHVA